MYHTGHCLCNGHGVACDEEAGVVWLEQAMTKGFAEADTMLKGIQAKRQQKSQVESEECGQVRVCRHSLRIVHLSPQRLDIC